MRDEKRGGKCPKFRPHGGGWDGRGGGGGSLGYRAVKKKRHRLETRMNESDSRVHGR